MATHCSIFVWRIPGTEEPSGLPSMGVAQSRTRLKRLSSSSSIQIFINILCFISCYSGFVLASMFSRNNFKYRIQYCKL